MLAERIDFFLFHDSWKCEKKKRKGTKLIREETGEFLNLNGIFVVSRIIN